MLATKLDSWGRAHSVETYGTVRLKRCGKGLALVSCNTMWMKAWHTLCLVGITKAAVATISVCLVTKFVTNVKTCLSCAHILEGRIFPLWWAFETGIAESALVILHEILILKASLACVVGINVTCKTRRVKAIIASDTITVPGVNWYQISAETLNLPRLVKEEVKHPVLLEFFIFTRFKDSVVIELHWWPWDFDLW